MLSQTSSTSYNRCTDVYRDILSQMSSTSYLDNRCTDVYRDMLSQTSSTSYLEPLVAYENQCLMTELFCM